MPHGHCSPQGPGQGAAACPSVSHGMCKGKLGHHPGKHDAAPSGPERSFQQGALGLALLSLAVIPLLDSAFSLPAALHRLMLELYLIFLARPVILSSSHSTSQSALGTTAAQQGQLCLCGGPGPQGLCLTKPFGTVVVFYSSSLLSLLTLFKCIVAFFGLSFTFSF